MVAFSSFPMTRRRRSAAQPSYASTMTAVVAAVLVFACVILSSVHEADAQGTTQEYDAMPRHGRSLLQDEPLKDVACDDKCQKWVRSSLVKTGEECPCFRLSSSDVLTQKDLCVCVRPVVFVCLYVFQARFLSALMVSVFMIGAIVSAMCCLAGLRTPRQFETAKEE